MNNPKFINTTSHTVEIKDVNGKIIKLRPSNKPFRLKEHICDGIIKNGIQIMKIEYKIPEIPKYDPNVYYVVSKLVAFHVGRSDFIAPDTGESAVRKNGNIERITRLYTYD